MKLRLLVTVLAVACAGPAIGQTAAVNAARAAGQVGERYDGYLGISGPVSATVRSQVSSINILRRSLYSGLAANRGATPQDIGVTAGCELLGRVAVGEAYMWVDGQWRRRMPGQPLPLPSYCR